MKSFMHMKFKNAWSFLVNIKKYEYQLPFLSEDTLLTFLNRFNRYDFLPDTNKLENIFNIFLYNDTLLKYISRITSIVQPITSLKFQILPSN